MECKRKQIAGTNKHHYYWNISRMECKKHKNVCKLGIKDTIGIYPEWNVKVLMYFRYGEKAMIGIYPEWNVKFVKSRSFSSSSSIGIYPEWNVKIACIILAA